MAGPAFAPENTADFGLRCQAGALRDAAPEYPHLSRRSYPIDASRRPTASGAREHGPPKRSLWIPNRLARLRPRRTEPLPRIARRHDSRKRSPIDESRPLSAGNNALTSKLKLPTPDEACLPIRGRAAGLAAAKSPRSEHRIAIHDSSDCFALLIEVMSRGHGEHANSSVAVYAPRNKNG